MKSYNTRDALHQARYSALDEDEKHALGDEKAFDSITRFIEGCAVSIELSAFAIGTHLTMIWESVDASNDNASEVHTAA